MPPFEVLMPLGAAGLYLFDSALLCYSNELLYLRRGRRWDFAAGSGLILFGRGVCVPNPFTPHVPQFRIRWSDRDPRAEREDARELEQFAAALRPVQYLVRTLLLLLLALPIELLWLGTGYGLLSLFAAFYGVILTALGYIYARRRELRLSGKALLAISLDALACAPFAINLARKLAMHRSLAGNPVVFARETFSAEIFARLVRVICGRIVEEQLREHAQSGRWAELEAYRTQLMGMAPCQPSK